MLAALAILAACAESDPSRRVFHDPYEGFNRQVHGLNKALDQAVVAPVARAYGTAVPAGIRTMAANFAGNLSEPRYAVNHLLQGDVHAFLGTTLRFVMNTTLGIGGLADPAGELGLDPQSTSFGATLGTWGVAEGAYVELPLFGPSSERDTAGRVADFLLDPVNALTTPPQARLVTSARALDLLGTRHTFDPTISSVLYDSEDSYARSRLLYLQSVRGAADGPTDLDDLEDPYAE